MLSERHGTRPQLILELFGARERTRQRLLPQSSPYTHVNVFSQQVSHVAAMGLGQLLSPHIRGPDCDRVIKYQLLGVRRSARSPSQK